MKIKLFKISLLFIPFMTLAQVGIDSKKPTEPFQPTEDLHVNGTMRVNELPTNGTNNAIYTQPDGTASNTKDQPFTATKTVVADENGVLGVVEGLPVVNIPTIKALQFTSKTVPITANTATDSEITLGNLKVRYNATSASDGAEPISFKLTNNITDLNGNPATEDLVIVNQTLFYNGGNHGAQDKFTVQKDAANWTNILKQQPNVSRNDFAQYNIALIRTKEIYRLSVAVNKNITGNNVSSPAQVSLILEKLTN